MTQNLLFGLSAMVLFVLGVSLAVRVKFNNFWQRNLQETLSGDLDVAELVRNISADKGLGGVKVRKGESLAMARYDLNGIIHLPDLPEDSLLYLGVALHELAHLEQENKVPFLPSVLGLIGVICRAGTYLFFPVLIVGILFYWPLVYAGLLVYLLVAVLVVIEIPIEIDASRRAISYANCYYDPDTRKLKKLKQLLRLAILTRLTVLTTGFLEFFLRRGE